MTDLRPRRITTVAAIGIAGVAALQVALALGAPLGRAAWGGAHITLPADLRAGSAGSAVFLAATALTVFTYGRRTQPAPTAHRWATRALDAPLALNALANFASPSH